MKPKCKPFKKDAIYEICRKMTELRQKPLSPTIYEIIRENYELNIKGKDISSDPENGEKK